MPLLTVALAAAAAASPMPGQTYEGPAPKGGQEVILVASAKPNRIERLTFGFERGCRRAGRRLPQPNGSVFLRKLKVRGGRFSWRRTIRYPSTGGSLRTVLRGRFSADGTRFTGTVRERVRNPQTRVRCDSGKVRFRGAVPERALINGAWAGQTAQGLPLALRIGSEGIETLDFNVSLTCGNGEQIVRPVGVLEETGRIDDEDLTFSTGTWTLDTRIRVTGKARRGLVSGTIVAEDSISRPDGDDERTYSCSSGDVPFEARPA